MLLDKQLINGLTEKDVEIDHLKTTVVALQEKVVVSILLMYMQTLGGIAIRCDEVEGVCGRDIISRKAKWKVI